MQRIHASAHAFAYFYSLAVGEDPNVFPRARGNPRVATLKMWSAMVIARTFAGAGLDGDGNSDVDGGGNF